MKTETLIVVLIAVCLCPSFGWSAVIHVPEDASTIQAGIDLAEDTDTILVADGTYTGAGNRDIDFQGKWITVESENGPYACIIDAEHQGIGFIFQTNESMTAQIRGFTVQHGMGDTGGAIFCNYSSPIIENCYLTNNQAMSGGAIYCINASPAVIGCTMIGNQADDNGGAIFCSNASPDIINCVMNGNFARIGGGLCSVWFSDPTLMNCLIARNFSSTGGAVASSNISFVTIMNSTLAENQAVCGGILCDIASITIIDSIVWRNTGDPFCLSDASIDITFSTIQGGFEGAGNIDADPQFQSGPQGDFYLAHLSAGETAGSPCIDAGSDLAEKICFSSHEGSVCLSDLTTRTDLEPDQGRVDMGFHYPPESSCHHPGCRVEMPSRELTPGATCYCRVHICNPYPESWAEIPLFVILDVAGSCFFAPGFSDYDYYLVDVASGETVVEVLPEFIWPEGVGSASGIVWYAGLTDPDITELTGEIAIFSFGWHED